LAGVSDIQNGVGIGRTLKRVLVAGTAAAADVAIADIDANDVLVSVFSFTTAAAIATVADRTSEYTIHEGGLDKAAGTDETNNQLDVTYWDCSA